MPTQDTTEIKNKIINFLREKGPSLPIQISREIGTDSIFASAFLSELLSQKKIKITHMKVGGSPLYFLPGSEEKLEKFGEEFLKSKEKEAFLLLKEKKLLEDSAQESAIRIALRAIKDFAIAKEKDGKLYWEYFLKEKEPTEPSMEEPKKEIKQAKHLPEKPETPSKEKKKKRPTKKEQEKKNEMFFNTVKENLKERGMEITDILSFSRGVLIMKVKDQENEKLLIAYNKKKLTDTDILNAYKKANEYDMQYIIFSMGEPSKKTISLIEAIKDLSSIEKIK